MESRYITEVVEFEDFVLIFAFTRCVPVFSQVESKWPSEDSVVK